MKTLEQRSVIQQIALAPERVGPEIPKTHLAQFGRFKMNIVDDVDLDDYVDLHGADSKMD